MVFGFAKKARKSEYVFDFSDRGTIEHAKPSGKQIHVKRIGLSGAGFNFSFMLYPIPFGDDLSGYRMPTFYEQSALFLAALERHGSESELSQMVSRRLLGKTSIGLSSSRTRNTSGNLMIGDPSDLVEWKTLPIAVQPGSSSYYVANSEGFEGHETKVSAKPSSDLVNLARDFSMVYESNPRLKSAFLEIVPSFGNDLPMLGICFPRPTKGQEESAITFAVDLGPVTFQSINLNKVMRPLSGITIACEVPAVPTPGDERSFYFPVLVSSSE